MPERRAMDDSSNKIGSYNPMTSPATVEIDTDKALDWLEKGAQPTDTARAILRFKGVLYKKHLMRGVKKGALTQEQADQMFSDFMTAKNERVAARLEKSKQAELDRMAAISGTAPVVEEVVEEVEEAVEAVAEATEENAKEATEATEEAATAVEEVAESAAEAVEEAVKEETKEVKEAVEETAEKAEEVSAETAEKAEEVVEEAAEKVEEVVEEATKEAEEVVAEVADKGDEAAEAADPED